MASQPIDNTAFLAQLEAQLRDFKAKVAALEATITALKSAVAIGALQTKPPIPPASSPAPVAPRWPPTQNPTPPTAPPPVRPKPYADMTIASAITAFLKAAQIREYSAQVIASALLNNGIESSSDNFTNVVTAALHRLKEKGDAIEDKQEKADHVQKFQGGWGLNKWAQGWNEDKGKKE